MPLNDTATILNETYPQVLILSFPIIAVEECPGAYQKGASGAL